MTNIDVERKVTQLDSDVHEIYTLLARIDTRLDNIEGMQRRQGNRLDDIDAKLGSVLDLLKGRDIDS